MANAITTIATRLVKLENEWNGSGPSFENILGADFLSEGIPGAPVLSEKTTFLEKHFKRVSKERERAIVLASQGKLTEAEKILLEVIEREKPGLDEKKEWISIQEILRDPEILHDLQSSDAETVKAALLSVAKKIADLENVESPSSPQSQDDVSEEEALKLSDTPQKNSDLFSEEQETRVHGDRPAKKTLKKRVKDIIGRLENINRNHEGFDGVYDLDEVMECERLLAWISEEKGEARDCVTRCCDLMEHPRLESLRKAVLLALTEDLARMTRKAHMWKSSDRLYRSGHDLCDDDENKKKELRCRANLVHMQGIVFWDLDDDDFDHRVLNAEEHEEHEEKETRWLKKHALALWHFWKSEKDEGIRLLKDVLRDQRRELGETHPDTLDTMIDFTKLKLKLELELKKDDSEHFPDDAQTELRNLLVRCKRVLGVEAPDTLHIQCALGISLMNRREDKEKASRLLDDTLSRQRHVLGETHAETLKTIDALIEGWDGDHERKRWYFFEKLNMLRRDKGEAHDDTATTKTEFAAWLRTFGKHDEANAVSQRSHGSASASGSDGEEGDRASANDGLRKSLIHLFVQWVCSDSGREKAFQKSHGDKVPITQNNPVVFAMEMYSGNLIEKRTPENYFLAAVFGREVFSKYGQWLELQLQEQEAKPPDTNNPWSKLLSFFEWFVANPETAPEEAVEIWENQSFRTVAHDSSASETSRLKSLDFEKIIGIPKTTNFLEVYFMRSLVDWVQAKKNLFVQSKEPDNDKAHDDANQYLEFVVLATKSTRKKVDPKRVNGYVEFVKKAITDYCSGEHNPEWSKTENEIMQTVIRDLETWKTDDADGADGADEDPYED